MTSGHALLPGVNPVSEGPKHLPRHLKRVHKQSIGSHARTFGEIMQEKKATKTSRPISRTIPYRALHAGASQKKGHSLALVVSHKGIHRGQKSPKHPVNVTHQAKKTVHSHKSVAPRGIQVLHRHNHQMLPFLSFVPFTAKASMHKVQSPGVVKGHKVIRPKHGEATLLNGPETPLFQTSKGHAALATPSSSSATANRHPSAVSQANETLGITKRKLVFVRRLKDQAQSETSSGSVHNTSKPLSVAKSRVVTTPNSRAETISMAQAENPSATSGERSTASHVQPVLVRAVQQGVLKRRGGGWVIKPVNWRAPGGINASKWTLTMPKQARSLLMTLVHMQKSWKVDLEANSPAVAGALAENLSQTPGLVAASLPVSQVSVFLGLGHHQAGHGEGSGGSGSGALADQRNSNLSQKEQPGSGLRSLGIPRLGPVSYSRVDYQA